MPELAAQCIPPVGPSTWEDHEGFRETLLLHFTRPGDAAAMRQFGSMLFECALAAAGEWPATEESPTRAELRAALADLRHLEGFLQSVGAEDEVASLSSADGEFSRFAKSAATEVGAIADRIEAELANTGVGE